MIKFWFYYAIFLYLTSQYIIYDRILYFVMSTAGDISLYTRDTSIRRDDNKGYIL